MSIRSKILDVKRGMLLELLGNDKTISNRVQDLAIAAINDGPGSKARREYMSMFAETEAELRRLMAEDDTKNVPSMDRARGYLMADGPCGTETVTNFGNNTTIILDTGLTPEPNP